MKHFLMEIGGKRGRNGYPRVKYEIMSGRKAILYSCPECSSFNCIERTGQIMYTEDDKEQMFVIYTVTQERWMSCASCNDSFFMDEVVKVNRKNLTEEQHEDLERSVEFQSNLQAVFEHIVMASWNQENFPMAALKALPWVPQTTTLVKNNETD